MKILIGEDDVATRTPLEQLVKPFEPGRLAALLSQHGGHDDAQAHAQAEEIRKQVAETGQFGSLVGRSETMQELFGVIARVARSDAPVLITGESGTGKEAAAVTIHQLSRRRSVPMVAINCGAVSATLIESELFGHERGSFTGAESTRIGTFEMAKGGSLFLDEVTEMSPDLQVKFLRVLESRTFRRVGGNDELEVDCRIISSSNRSIEDAVRSERLRGDLYYRLNVLPLRMPPLRERREDIGLLAQHFLERIDDVERAGLRAIDPAAIELLQTHSWPGNVRELRNVIHRAYVLSDGSILAPETVRKTLTAFPEPPTDTQPEGAGVVRMRVGQSMDEVEKQFLKETLVHVKGNKKKAAELLRISLKTIYNKIKQYRIVI